MRNITLETCLCFPVKTRFGVRSMHVMKECFVPFSIGFALQKDSIYTERFSRKIQQLIEGGFIDKWLRDEFDNVAKKADVGASSKAEPLVIYNLQVNIIISLDLSRKCLYILFSIFNLHQ